jgi:hypothetical protein
MVGDSLDQAREAFGRQAWGAARSTYAAAIDQALTLDDIERYAIAAHLIGNDAESRELLARGHRPAAGGGRPSRGSRSCGLRADRPTQRP